VIKAASSLDGKIAMPSGESKWITTLQTREFSAQLRSRYQAIMVGSRTLIEDNPRLTNRSKKGVRQPVRVVVSSSGELPLTASFFADDGVRKMVFTGCQITDLQLQKIKTAGITVFVAKTKQPTVSWVLKKLYAEKICSVLVEGGGKLISSFLKVKLVDKLYLFQSGKLIANPKAISWSGDLGVEKLKDTPNFKFQKVELIGEDILITAVPKFR
jgi:diaminohydroxyphosphoribosylaminopyrimidine deaminase/5-amino-6-(5-phosphoribosylamino)uracil reductase